jgi:hypothetical protein
MAITVTRVQGYVDFCPNLGLRLEWETAQDELLESRQKGGDMLVDAASDVIAKKVQKLEQQMQAAMLRFRFEALERKRWNELGTEHPPRDGNVNDAALGVNSDTFYDAVAIESLMAVNKKETKKVVDFDPAEEWVPLANAMTNGQYGEFVEKFLELNRGKGSKVPFSRLASVVTQASAQK